ncbi:MAG: winged helix-turn-helix transcriptional regulator [Acidobacteria bacterium]|nr:winged helix-turn-helix transcriptional regulator [Acidobacteriota bacterium]
MVTHMMPDDVLKSMEMFYAALADKTRLRLLYLMRHGEAGVMSLSDNIGESQPKVSRHLAYLRQAGLVKTRRDGRSIYYSIAWPEERAAISAVESALEWFAATERPSARKNFVPAYTYNEEDVVSDVYTDVAEIVVETEEDIEDHFEPISEESSDPGSFSNEIEDFLL